MSDSAFVSIIVPCCNEQDYIEGCMSSILQQDYDPGKLEVLLIDGLSTDSTQDIIEKYVQKHPVFKLLINHNRTVPHALNLGVLASRGNYIVRMDVHCLYPTDYVSKLILNHQRLKADNVGAVLLTKAANDSATALAIAAATSHPFGVGNSLFRTGADDIKLVDTVPFGCYKRDVFDSIGLFDEELTRNQDDEFNGRLLKAGGQIYLIPEIVVTYFARNSLRSLFRMYYQYGLFKPLVAKKLGSPVTFRQLVPAMLVVSMLATAMAAIFTPVGVYLFAAICLSYLTAILAVASTESQRGQKGSRFRLGVALVAAFACLHFSYGIGYLLGIRKLFAEKTSLKATKPLKLSR